MIDFSLTLAAVAAFAGPPQTPRPDTFLARLEVFALMQTLNADLLSHDSATLTLERWCAAHGLAAPVKVSAEQVKGDDAPASEEVREALSVTPGEIVRHRRVRLRCGDHVLSVADNWYVPDRLTPAMNALLETSDVPFGRAVSALRFQRRTLSARLLFSPLPVGWERGAPLGFSGTEVPSPFLEIPYLWLEHRAVLTTPAGLPISEVVETYTREALNFPVVINPPPRP